MIRQFLLGASVLAMTAGSALAQDDTTADSVAAPEAEAAPVYDASDASTVLARVNGEEITLGHIILLRQGLPDNYQTLPDDVLFTGILDQLIEQMLLGQTRGAEMSDAIRLQLDNERRAMQASAAVDALLNRNISDAELQALYDAEIAIQPPVPEFNASHILVETEAEALALIEQLNAGADFAELAAANSTDTGSGAQGGSLGWFGLGRMVPEFEGAVIALEVGQTTQTPVQSQFGFHIVHLDDKREQPLPTLAQLRDQLVQEIQRRAVTAEVERLTAAATIERDLVNIDPAQTAAYDLIGN